MGAGPALYGVALGDIEGDGDLDIDNGELNAGTVSRRLNTGLNSGTYMLRVTTPGGLDARVIVRQ